LAERTGVDESARAAGLVVKKRHFRGTRRSGVCETLGYTFTPSADHLPFRVVGLHPADPPERRFCAAGYGVIKITGQTQAGKTVLLVTKAGHNDDITAIPTWRR